MQEMRLSLEHLSHQMHSHAVELTLFQERVQQLETTLQSLKQGQKNQTPPPSLEKKVSTLEKAYETLISDFKTLKEYLNQTGEQVALCQTQLQKLDKHLSADIQTLKTSLHTMLTLLQGEEKIYTVKPGDSLGHIALDHKTDIKTLKALNNLTTDTIYSGQKLQLP